MGQSSRLVGYLAPGASSDYTYSIGIKHSYTIELPSTISFLLPPEDIKPVAEELWMGLKCFVKFVSKNKKAKKLCKKTRN